LKPIRVGTAVTAREHAQLLRYARNHATTVGAITLHAIRLWLKNPRRLSDLPLDGRVKPDSAYRES